MKCVKNKEDVMTCDLLWTEVLDNFLCEKLAGIVFASSKIIENSLVKM